MVKVCESGSLVCRRLPSVSGVNEGVCCACRSVLPGVLEAARCHAGVWCFVSLDPHPCPLGRVGFPCVGGCLVCMVCTRMHGVHAGRLAPSPWRTCGRCAREAVSCVGRCLGCMVCMQEVHVVFKRHACVVNMRLQEAACTRNCLRNRKMVSW